MNVKPETVGVQQLRNDSAHHAFIHWLDKESDIKDHLMFLFRNAKGLILELGTRGGVSTSAFLYGLELNGGFLYSVDMDFRCQEVFKGHRLWRCYTTESCDPNLKRNIPAYDYEVDVPRLDVLFIDTEHTYAQLQKELDYWGPCVKRGGRILIHDVLSFPDMAKAAEEYSSSRNLIYMVRPGSNGLGVIHS